MTGLLDPTLGGPDLDPGLDQTSRRRSLYFRHAKEKQATFLKLFDSANPTACYRRAESVVPQQALALANSPLSFEQSRLLAAELSKRVGSDPSPAADRAFVAAAFERILSRPPTAEESDECGRYIDAQAARFADTSKLTPFAAGPASTRQARRGSRGSAPARTRPRAAQPQRLRDDPLTPRTLAMNSNRASGLPRCCGVSRRTFLADCGMGFTGLVLCSMLHRDGVARADASAGWSPPDGRPHFAPKAKSVIWLFMVGGTSHMESFDPKPELNKYAGKTIAETPYKDVLDSPHLKKNLRELIAGLHNGPSRRSTRCRSGFRKRGESGIEVSDWWPHLGDCIDDIAVVRSMWTTDNNHGAQLQFHTGRHIARGQFPDDRLVGPLRPGLAQRRPARSSSSWARPSPTAAADEGDTGPTTSAPSTTASSWPSTRRTRSPSPRPGRTSTTRSSRASSSCSGG